ncbi:cysteine desulfurase [Candidatus Woesearchaeota archaeon]|nr:cysteine desulfurase [Candidatus Woesearchaeota archaeon]
MKTIYLDYAAATPLRHEAAAAMKPFLSENYANPSSIHAAGRKVRDVVEKARAKIQTIINAKDASEIIFTGSGTESINLALKGIMRFYRKQGNHLITTKIEHKAVLETCAYLEKYCGCKVTYLDVDATGKVNPKDVEKAITSKTILISIIYANNEIGTIQPMAEIAAIAKKHRIFIHTDACQAAGQLLIDVNTLGVDLMTINGSKIYGPKGSGFLYIRNGIKLIPLIHGGGQEFGLRSGTENTAGIIGLASALELAERERNRETKRLQELQKYCIHRLVTEIPSCRLNGSPTERLSNNINISFARIDAETVIKMLSAQGIFASAGSACTANTMTISHVLQAIGVPRDFAQGTIRLTLGKETTKKELDHVILRLKEDVSALRKSTLKNNSSNNTSRR